MAWTCDQTEDRLLEAFDGTLSAAERGEMEQHTSACARCVALVASVRQTVNALQQMEPVEPDPWLVPKIIARTTGPKPVRRRRLGWLDFMTHPRFAMGLVAVLITVSIVFHAVSGGAPGALASVNPFEFYRQADRRAHLVYARGVKFFSDLRVVYEIQSRFQPENKGEPATTPEKKNNTDQLERLFYDRLESRLGPAVTHVQGDQHEMRYPS
ncbi:MAG: zf-HC2 domain-containing protein [Acidobacteriota bacterium]|nr:zf-HC2 domain-containing protein [Acidobacteriota bacterium]